MLLLFAEKCRRSIAFEAVYAIISSVKGRLLEKRRQYEERNLSA